jgi:hypothetical protein
MQIPRPPVQPDPQPDLPRVAAEDRRLDVGHRRQGAPPPRDQCTVVWLLARTGAFIGIAFSLCSPHARGRDGQRHRRRYAIETLALVVCFLSLLS